MSNIKAKDCTPIKYKNVGLNQPFISHDNCPVLINIMDNFYIKMCTNEGSIHWENPEQKVYLIPTTPSDS